MFFFSLFLTALKNKFLKSCLLLNRKFNIAVSCFLYIENVSNNVFVSTRKLFRTPLGFNYLYILLIK